MFEDTVSFRLVHIIKAHRDLVSAHLAGIGLHVGQEMLLAQLWARDGMSQSELSDALCKEPPTITKTLQRLERSGLVRRTPDPANRRISRVYLTERGRELKEPVLKIWREAEDALLSGLDTTDRELLERVLIRMSTNFSRT